MSLSEERSPKVARVAALYEALNRRDWVALQRQLSPDLVLRVAGRSALAGEHRGLGAAIALTTKVERRLLPQQSEINELKEDLAGVHVTVTVSIKTPDGAFRPRLHELFRFDDEGLIREIWVKAEDQGKVDAFLQP